MVIYIIRHGETVWNLEKRKQGHKDSPLTWKGIEQAVASASKLQQDCSNLSTFSFYVSPLYRARQCAQIIKEKLDITHRFTVEYNLREHGFGAWEGKTQNYLDQKHPEEIAQRLQDRWNYIIPGGGESYNIIYRRAKYFIDRVTEDEVVLICHEMISKVIRGYLLNMPQEVILDLEHPHDTIYKYDGKEVHTIR